MIYRKKGLADNMNEIILQNKDGKILVSSRDVAEKFRKNHKDVLRSINNISKEINTAHFCTLFESSDYKASNGKTNKEYLMTRDGFSLLCMGFTGSKALDWKLKYIEAFNKMEEKLKSGSYLSEEEKLKLQLFSKDPIEVAAAHNKLIELKTALLQKTIEKQDSQLQIQKPFVQTAIKLQKSDGVVDMKTAAKWLIDDGIDIGRNRLMELLRKNKVFMGDNTPYQKYMDLGLFKVQISTKETHWGTKINPVTLVTGKGLIFLNKKLREWLKLDGLDINIDLDSLDNSLHNNGADGDA